MNGRSARSPSRRRDRRASITTETNTATPSAPAFVPSMAQLDHSLVLHDNAALAVHSANLPSESVRPDAYVETGTDTTGATHQSSPSATSPGQLAGSPKATTATTGATTGATGYVLPPLEKDPEHTNDDEQVRIPTSTVSSNAVVRDVRLAPDEFGRITTDVQRISQNHCPPDWHRDEEVDRSTVPGAEEYQQRHHLNVSHSSSGNV
ncbi:hypothetical protein BDF22DRAFT_694716 [Syncephalis plumigaleata]|nr:hypothetical protein BDF22DRAFT_694716 [Syncephalis plumigaleata]